MVVFDNSFLTLVLHPTLRRPPKDPATGRTVDRVQERVDLLLETLERDRETIIIPTPVLTEFLILVGDDGPHLLSKFDSDKNYQVEPFDQRAAVELAVMNRAIRAKGGGRRGDQEGTYAKITFDRQIVAIAKVHGVTAIYSDDDGLGKFAEKNGLTVVRTWELPLPEVDPQQDLFMHDLAAAAESDPVKMLTGQTIEPNGTKEGNDEKEPAPGAWGTVGPTDTRISTVSGFSPAPSVSPEKGSGRAEGEAGEAGEG